MKNLICFFFFLFICSVQGSAEEFIPEASGACKVKDSVLIASDEVSGALWVQRNEGITKVNVKDAKWDDLEGMASAGGPLFFAITSHGLTKKGKRKPERELLFLMTFEEKVSVKKSWSLREKILSALEKHLGDSLDLETVRSAIPDDGGLNVEGLSYLEGKLYLGLRSPVTKIGEAILLELGNATADPVVENVVTIPLSGNGIRGLETRADELLILAGTTKDADTGFGLYRYRPQTKKLSSLALGGFSGLARPESLVHDEGGILFVQDFQDERDDVIVRLGY